MRSVSLFEAASAVRDYPRRYSVLRANSALTDRVVPLADSADLRQAQYYRALLSELRAHVSDDIAQHYLALEQHEESQDRQGTYQVRQLIRERLQQQFELDCLFDALNQRFFPTLAAPSTPPSCFDIEMTRARSWWRVRIPELNDVVNIRRRGQAEMAARKHIAANTGVPIAQVAVREVPGGSTRDNG